MNARQLSVGFRDVRVSYNPNTRIAYYLGWWGIRHTFRQEQPEGVQHGVTSSWMNADLHEMSMWYNGKLHGAYETYWPLTGKLKSVTNWVHGVQHGVSESWYSNGVMEFHEEYHDGKCHGTSTIWSRDGKVKLVATWDNGRETSIVVY